MAARYWVGGTNTWDGTAGSKWATTSGGAGGSAVPTAADDVFFDAASGAVVVTISGTRVCRSYTTTGFTGSFAGTATPILTIGDAGGGSFVMGAGVTSVATTIAIVLASTSNNGGSGWVFTTNGVVLPSINFNGAGGKWVLQDDLICASANTVTLTAGTLDTNSKNITASRFINNGSSTRTLTMGSTVWTLSSTTSAAWTVGGSGLTITANTATVNVTGASSTVTPAGVNHQGASLVITNTSTISTSASTSTWANLTITGTASKTIQVNIGANIVITGTVTYGGGNSVQGNNRLWVKTNIPGTQQTITCAAVVISGDVDFMDITHAGSPTWTNAGSAFVGDCGGNGSLITMNRTTPTTQTWNGAGGAWSTTARWTSRVPLPQDNAIVGAGVTSGNISNDMPRMCADLNFTGFSGQWTRGGVDVHIFGSLIFSATMTANNNSTDVSFRGRGSHTITSNGYVIVGAALVGFFAPGGTYTLTDAFSVSSSTAGTVEVDSGTFITNNNAILCGKFVSDSGRTRVVTLGTSVIDVTVLSTATIVSVTAAGLTLSAASATFLFSTASANTRTFAGGSQTYGTLTYTVAGSTGQLNITGANTFGTINFSDVTNARTLAFTAATTTTITSSFNVNGTSGKLMSVNSITAATHTLSKTSGTVSSDYLSLTNSIATGGAGWYAGANSTNVSGNSGWIFTAPPTNQGNMFLMF